MITRDQLYRGEVDVRPQLADIMSRRGYLVMLSTGLHEPGDVVADVDCGGPDRLYSFTVIGQSNRTEMIEQMDELGVEYSHHAKPDCMYYRVVTE